MIYNQSKEKTMKKFFMMGALLLAVVCAAADNVIDLSVPQAWGGKSFVEVGAGTLKAVQKRGIFAVSRKLIPVDDKHTYNFSGTLYVPEGKNEDVIHICYQMFDANKRFIAQVNAVSKPGSLAELAAPVKKGDNTFKIKTNEKWKMGSNFNCLIGFNVNEGKLSRDNSTGYIKSVLQNGDTMTVALSKPIHKDYPAGTKVRIQQRTFPFLTVYIIRSASGKEIHFGRELKKSQFWSETAYIRPMIMVRMQSSPSHRGGADVNTLLKNLKLTIKEIK